MPNDGRIGSFAALLATALLLLVPVPPSEAGQGDAQVLELTLDHAIALALRNNRDLRRARLAREAERFELEVAGDRYRPRVNVSASARDDNRRSGTGVVSVGPSIQVPTGGEFHLSWSRPLAGGQGGPGTWTLGFSQPLLKGFGFAIDTAPLRTARIRERMNVLSFRDTVAETVESVVRAYRRVVREHRALSISRDSLARSKRQLETNRSLVRAGRLARRDIVRNEAEIATRELVLVESENDLESANAELVSILDIDEAARLVPVDTTLSVEVLRPDPEESVATAFGSRTDYLRALLDRELAAISKERAEDEQRWDLSVTANVSRGDDDGRDYGVAVGLNVPIGYRSDELSLLRAKTRLREAEIALVELRQSIRIDVRQALHEVAVGLRRIELARRSLDLAQQQLEVERSKLAQGLSSAYQLTVVEEDLVRAQNVELDAIVSHLDAVTSLDRALGTTLQTWGIDVEEVEFGSGQPEDPEMPDGAGRLEDGLETLPAPVEHGIAAAYGHGRRPEGSHRSVHAAGSAGSLAGGRARSGRSLLLSLGELESAATADRAAAASEIRRRSEPPVQVGAGSDAALRLTLRIPASVAGRRTADGRDGIRSF